MSNSSAATNNVKPNAMAAYFARRAGADPSTPQMSVLGNSVVSSLSEMAEMAKAKMATSTLKGLIGDDEKDQTKELTSVVSLAKDLAAIDESRTRSTREELQQEREHRRRLEDQARTTSTQAEGSLVTMMMQMMNMQRESDQKWQERMEQRDRQHREEMRLLEEKLAGKKNEPKQQHPMDEIAHQLLLQRLNSEPPSIHEELARAKELTQLVSPPPSNNNSDLARLQYELAREKLQHEQQLRREEMEHRLEIESRRAQGTEKIVGALGPIFAMLSGQASQQQPPAQPQSQRPTGTGATTQPQAMHRYRCTNEECAKEWLHPVADSEGTCPKCGSELEYMRKEMV